MTMPYDPKKLRDQVWTLAMDLIAVGLDTKYMFIQSLVPEHDESYILSLFLIKINVKAMRFFIWEV